MEKRENPLEVHRIKNLAFSVASQIKTQKGYDLFIDALKGSWNELQDYEETLRKERSEDGLLFDDIIYPTSTSML